MSKRTLAILALVAGALPELLPMFLEPEMVMHVLAIVSAIGATLTGVMRSPLDRSEKPSGRSASTFPPVMGALLLLALLASSGCGASVPAIATARDVIDNALSCADDATQAADVRSALLACAPEAIGVLHTLCAASVLPKGEFCDTVAGL